MYDWAELRHFRYLLVILEKQGFRIAAEELHTSQPNLTVQARQFQENASIRLFRKTKNGRIRPTETGTAFITLARLLLETRDEVIEALTAIERGEIGSVRFGCAPLVDPGLFRIFCDGHKEILPACSIRPTHGDTAQLAEEVLTGAVDAAIVTLPLDNTELQIEALRRDRLVVCLRRDSPWASKSALQTTDLQDNLAVLYHPKRHPEAHERLLELLRGAGIELRDYSHASHPLEMQALVREGHGLSLIREGTRLDEELTTRPIAGVDWSVDTAVIYHKQRHPKTIPLLIKKLKRELNNDSDKVRSNTASGPVPSAMALRRRPIQSARNAPLQLSFPNETSEASSG